MSGPGTSLSDLGLAQVLAYALQLTLGGVFLLSAVPKLRHPRMFRQTLAGYGLLNPEASRALAPALIGVETFLALSFLSGWLLMAALPIAITTLVAFGTATWVNLRRGRRVPCGCFGNARELISRRGLARLAFLTSAVLVLAGVLSSPDVFPVKLDWLASRGPAAVAFTLDVAAVSAFLVIAAIWAMSVPELKAVLRPRPRVSRSTLPQLRTVARGRSVAR
jgi:hypothetical protein